MRMTRRFERLQKVARLSPLLSLALMAGLPAAFSHSSGDQAAISARHDEVARAIEDAPFRIGAWSGEIVPVPTAAVEILQSNAILSCRYTSVSEKDKREPVTVLLVHCSDARDMQGHYPPNCYPANGWQVPKGKEAFEIVVPVGNHAITMRVYSFESIDDRRARKRVRIFNCFVMPDGSTAWDLDVVAGLSQRYATSVQGVAQLQLVMSAEESLEDSIRSSSELLTGIEPILAILGQGAQESCQVELTDSIIPTRW
jgi:hypothetical protein